MENKQKRIAIINDITGFGRCSVAVMAPILNVMKIQSVVIPTAILSTHTQFPVYHFDDYTKHMNDYIQTYKDLNLTFDAIETGFIGSVEQIDIIINFIKHFKKEHTFVLVDPVMGDYGNLYKTYTLEMTKRMKELVQYADILTPNLTELCVLTDTPYNPSYSIKEIEKMCHKLSLQGVKHIIVTGISYSDTQILNYIYNTNDENKCIIVDRLGEDRSGTGDVIASIVAGSYLNGKSVNEAVKTAVDFTSKCLKKCIEWQLPNYYGLCIEEYLSELGE